MIDGADSENVIFSMRVCPNRSLDAFGRKICLCLIALTIFPIATAWYAFGVWMVLPFAGLEFVALWLAFYVVKAHDADYETLMVTDHAFRWERRRGRKIESLEGSRAWVRLVRCPAKPDAALMLRYAGKAVVLAGALSPDRRKAIHSQLSGIFQCATR